MKTYHTPLLLGAILSVSLQAQESKEEVLELENVIVSASLTEQNKAQTPAFSNVIYAKDITNSPAKSLADIIAQNGNVKNRISSTGRDNLQVRGMPSGYTLILVNGMRASSSGALWRGGDFDYNSIPLDSIERVEIIRGPAATVYGSDAMGGVVNIITKENTDYWRGHLNMQYTHTPSDDGKQQWRVGGDVSGPLSDSLSLSLSADKYQRDIWHDDTSKNPEVASLEEKKTGNLLATLRWQITDRQYASISAGYNKDERPHHLFGVSRGRKSYREQKIERNTVSFNHGADWDWGDSAFTFKYEGSTISDYNTRYKTNKQRTLKENNLYAKLYASSDIGFNSLLAGVEARSQNVEDKNSYINGSAKSDEVALFAQDAITLLDNVSLTLGGRYDYNEQYKGRFSPKVYLVTTFGDVSIKAGVSQAFKAPKLHQSFKEYSILSCRGKCFLRGNPDLKPETSINYELGAEINKKQLNFSAAVFHNQVKDMIAADRVAKKRVWSNLNKANITGVEMDANWKVTSDWTLKTSFTHLITAERVDKTGKTSELPSTVMDVARASIQWQALDFWQTQVGTDYTGREYDPFVKSELKPYQTYDWGNTFSITKDIRVTAGIKNLTDVRLPKVDEKYGKSIVGRNFYATLNYQF